MSSQQLSRTRVRAFIDDGFVRIDGAFSYQKGERLQFAEAIEVWLAALDDFRNWLIREAA